MEPTVVNGDWVLCRLVADTKQIEEKEMYVVISRNGAVLKYAGRVEKKGMWLTSANHEEFAPYFESFEDVITVWHVVLRITSALPASAAPVGDVERRLAELERMVEELRKQTKK